VRVIEWMMVDLAADELDRVYERIGHKQARRPSGARDRVPATAPEAWPMTSLAGPHRPPALAVMLGALATPLSA
jgi:hypothetical protein